MVLYRLEGLSRDRDTVNIYSRNVEEIGRFLEHYPSHVCFANGLLVTIRDAKKVDLGEFYFQSGVVPYRMNGYDSWNHIKVAQDFLFHFNDESVFQLERLRKSHLIEIAGLRKIEVDGELCRGITFIPQDVSEAIRNFDLMPYIEKARQRLNDATRNSKKYRG